MTQKKLTPEHTARFVDHRAKWIAAGLSTDPADFDKAEQAVRKIYQATGRKEPLVILRMGSPYAAIMGGYLAWAMLDGIFVEGDKQVGQQVEQQVRQQVEQQVEQQVVQQVWQQVRQQVRQQVEQQVRQQVEQQVRQQVRQQVEQQVRQQVEQQVEQQVWQQVWQQVGLQKISKKYGLSVYDYRAANLWAGWYSYVTFFIENGFLDGTTKAVQNYQLDREVAESCGLVWYSSAVAAISDRPEQLHRDERGRLHSETGPAILYRDGWAIHAWHGTVVPAHWIDQRDSLTPGEVLKTENVEQRAAGCAIIGWPKMLSVLEAKVLDADPDPSHGELIEVKMPGLPRTGRFLKAECPRNGTICEGVPPVSEIDGLPINTVKAAQSWRVGLRTDQFSYPEVRT